MVRSCVEAQEGGRNDRPRRLAASNNLYKFLGITEQLSWLAQFAGQGYEDISALANLIMLQEIF